MSRIEKIITGRDTTPPPAPTSIQVIGVTASSIALVCSASTDPTVPGEARTGVVSYRWYVSLDGSAFSLVGSTSTTAFTHLGLAAATRYYYRVSAVDFVGLESDLSAVASGLTDSGIIENRAPVWSSASLVLNVYPGQVVSRQLTYGSIAFEPGKDAWDVDGDVLEFSEAATGVLQALGLSVSSTGLIGGTIPAGATPQSLTFRLSVTDGKSAPVVKDGCQVVVFEVGDADEDWLARSRGDGVFYAINFSEIIEGTPTGTWAIDRTTKARRVRTMDVIGELPVSKKLIDANRWNLTQLDGKGEFWLETNPAIALSGGRALGVRNRNRWRIASPTDYTIPAFDYVPLDYSGADPYSTGVTNLRRGIKGTVGEGKTDLKYVETATSGLKSTRNPLNEPVCRQFYFQVQLYTPRRSVHGRPRPWAWNSMPGAVTDFNQNIKLLFVTGGQSTDQIAVTMYGPGVLHGFFYHGSGVTDIGRDVRILGTLTEFNHSNNDTGTPTITSTTPLERAMERYGVVGRNIVSGRGLRPDGQDVWCGNVTSPVAVLPDWVPPDVAATYGQSSADANLLSSGWRRYPFGGFPAGTGTYPYPELAWTDNMLGGIMRPDSWHVIEGMVSAQVDAPVDVDSVITALTEPVQPINPRFFALWAAVRGDEPKLIGYAGRGGNRGPGLIPSNSHRPVKSSDNSLGAPFILKWQDANTDTRYHTHFVVIGAESGYANPTSTEFYAVRANPPQGVTPAASTGYSATYINKGGEWAFDPGTMHNFAAGSAIGWCTGSLNGASYRPVVYDPFWYKTGGQYIVNSSEYQGASATITNPFTGALVTAPVHKFTTETMALAPAVGNACIWISYVDVNMPDNEFYWGEVIFSMEPIPFPGHLDKPLPMDWEA